MSVINGILLHGVGASAASLCYTPEKKLIRWSWQSYWLAQAFICWFLLPLIGAYITIPELATVLRHAPADAMWKSFALGAAYGIGGTAFGLAIQHIGFSLTYAISIGISCVLGTLLPPWVKGELTTVLSQPGSGFIILGMVLGVCGIAFCGIAGRSKEVDIASQEKDRAQNFNLGKGLFLSISAGVLSALYGFSLDQGQPIADVAAQYGAGQFQGNVIYIFSNTGAFIFPMVYSLYLHRKEGTFKEYFTPAEAGARRPLARNYLLAILTGCLWYSQFFFYGLGHTRMGDYEFTSWAIHMIMLVLLSLVTGLLLKEWVGSSKKTVWLLSLALLVLIGSVIVLTIGNSMGA
ncbi:L-rhamnose/proton symporter RhaT [Marinoscillum sp. MHG1-6]|uniref:L-rhamnose/proton symporter RhaT n=1 Tax=Marinoscillum sp. MHG1-6 TaxID=2959627 RepID=UPI0021573962|nr:L-rhamnose/proton symporter RhaT [Marinoscillum sp. MHG1-6]